MNRARSVHNPRAVVVGTALAVLSASCVSSPTGLSRTPSVAAPNDNRVAAGIIRDGVLHLELDAVVTGWRPDRDVDSAVTVQAFAERGKGPTVPGPLVRVPQGMEVRVAITNHIPDSTLKIHGLRAGSMPDDTISVAPGATREIAFVASNPGTFLYWGSTSGSEIGRRTGRDTQLSGAIVVDPVGVKPDPRERIFVISLIDVVPSSTTAGPRARVWEAAINGLSWPHTERLTYALGDTARWRMLNATGRPHPMHLHGFHFLVTSKGDGKSDTTYSPATRRFAVTEFMPPGTTFALEWHLTRPGNWLVHCHMIEHIMPFPERPVSARAHDAHDVDRHPAVSMAGLVLGVSVTDSLRSYATPVAEPVARHRLFLQERRPVADERTRKGFVLQSGAEPARDSVAIPGSPLVTVRGQRTSVTIVNRLSAPSSVHWHGMELESVFDGVAGYSGVGSVRAPLLAPGDSFTVWFTPPRAGTYMYHSHMDEEDQIASGMYAPLLVLEPDERYDPSTDLTMMIGLVPSGPDRSTRALNGATEPEPMRVRAGTTYRLRILNLLHSAPVTIELAAADSGIRRWRPISKDGATVPAALSTTRPARLRMGVGETYDFEWTAPPSESLLRVQLGAPPGVIPPPPLLQRLIGQP